MDKGSLANSEKKKKAMYKIPTEALLTESQTMLGTSEHIESPRIEVLKENKGKGRSHSKTYNQNLKLQK